MIESQRVYLRGGDQIKLTATIPDFKWSDDYYDDHPFDYLRGRNLMFLVRVEGDVCRDTNDITRGSTFGSRLMLKTRTNFTVEYPGNVCSRVWSTGDSMDTGAFTGNPINVDLRLKIFKTLKFSKNVLFGKERRSGAPSVG